MNIMALEGQRAVINYDPEIDMFRGEFLGLSGAADFYATTIRSLRAEGKISLRVYVQMCEEKGIEPFKFFSGKFNTRINPELHARAVELAAANGISLNQFVERAIQQEIAA